MKDFIGKNLDTLLYRVELLYKSAWLMSPIVGPQIARVATLPVPGHASKERVPNELSDCKKYLSRGDSFSSSSPRSCH